MLAYPQPREARPPYFCIADHPPRIPLLRRAAAFFIISFEHLMKNSYARFSLAIVSMSHLWTALVLCIFVAYAGAQNADRRIKIEALDGRNGKPIPDTHLLVFAGGTVEEVRQHRHYFDLHTSQNGNAELVLTSDSLKFIQVWVDGKTLCQSRPNTVSLSVEQILAEGFLAPNECGNLRMSSAPGQLFVFARPATLREKMER